MAGFNFLKCAAVQFRCFSQLLLRHAATHPFTANVCSKAFKLASLLLIEWHAPLRRGLILFNTAQQGVFWQEVCFYQQWCLR